MLKIYSIPVMAIKIHILIMKRHFKVTIKLITQLRQQIMGIRIIIMQVSQYNMATRILIFQVRILMRTNQEDTWNYMLL